MSVQLVTFSFNTGRLEQMVSFYSALGADLKPKSVSKGGQSYQGKLGPLGLRFYAIEKARTQASPDLSMQFEVAKIESVMDQLRAREDIQVLMDVESLPHGKQAIVLDPDGHSIEIFEPWAADGADGG